jgi:glycosyltransferase involved in cell wall biosynthesis
MGIKNILFVGPWPPPFGGISSHLYELLPSISNRGYNVVTLSYSKAKSEAITTERCVKNIYFSPKNFFLENKLKIIFATLLYIKRKKALNIKKFVRAVSIAVRVNQIIKHEKIEFLFTYGVDQLYIIPFINEGESKPKIFATIYAAFYLTPELYISDKPFLRNAFLKADKILSCSKYCVDSGKVYLEIDYPNKVIYNNVNEMLYRPDNDGREIRRKYNIPDNSIVLMTMGRMNADMGIDFLLKVCDRITSISSDLIVFFVGAEAELCAEVEKYAQTNEQVRFAFSIPLEEKPLFFAACDIFTAPTKEKHACMGIANIEAMMSGKAVISSTSGGHLETIENNISGILVPFNNGKLDADFFIDKLSILVNDTSTRNQLGVNGRLRAMKLFANEQIVDEHLNMINEY